MYFFFFYFVSLSEGMHQKYNCMLHVASIFKLHGTLLKYVLFLSACSKRLCFVDKYDSCFRQFFPLS